MHLTPRPPCLAEKGRTDSLPRHGEGLGERSGQGESRCADLLLANARVLTLDPRRPQAEAVVVRAGRISAVGTLAELRPLIGPATEVVDAEGGLAVPAFHDAHCHLLSYARSLSSLDCRAMRSLGHLQAALAEQAASLPPGTWIRAVGYDETLLGNGRHPDRCDLDAVSPHHPVRLQHRSLHLDILNTPALRLTGLMDAAAPELERDSGTGKPTGRLYHAAHLLRGRLPHQTEQDLAREVHAASERLLAWGVTSVQDASITNGAEEWELFHRLAARGDLGVRVFVLPGARHWRQVAASRPPSFMVRRGPVKFMLDEATSDQSELRAGVAEARAAGHAVALHAVSEAEVAMALDALRAAGPARGVGSDRIEHGAVIPDDWLRELRAAGVMVIGQPALVYQRGDAYRAEYPPELHGWLHRARSLLAAGGGYAAGSDAPVTPPVPVLGLFAARYRLTRRGASLGPQEALGPAEALAAFTLWPAQAVGAAQELGRLRPGALADVAVLDGDALEGPSPEAARRPVRLTVLAGRVVWRRQPSTSPCGCEFISPFFIPTQGP
ncbi:MAG: amidohydrolase family protein [Chloroflexi bacterium]|nr:amidohydrolase family protein [Chloroflexota bacterium]